MLLPALGLLLIFTVLYIISGKEYSGIMDHLNNKEDEQYKYIKRFLPVGFFILDRIGYKYSSRYDRKLFLKISEIYGAKEASFYLKAHMGCKIVFLILAVFIVMVLNRGIIFSISFIAAILFVHDIELDKRVKKRRMSILKDFPDFVNKLALLINAGLTVRRAWEKIAEDKKNSSDFYREAALVMSEIKAGKPEIKAYEDFAKRCRVSEVARFVTVILQNIRKGNAELVYILRVISNECWEMRKNAAKRLGEEAAAKMVLPLMLMFIAILIILATPAILTISQM